MENILQLCKTSHAPFDSLTSIPIHILPLPFPPENINDRNQGYKHTFTFSGLKTKCIPIDLGTSEQMIIYDYNRF